MIKFLSICQNTFVQTIRQPIYGILVLITFAALILNVPLSGWTMDPTADYAVTDQQMMESLGLSTLVVAGLLIAAFSASSVLSREIEDKTALTVISKPVSRAMFIFGKFAGVMAAVAVAYYLTMLVFLMTVRHKVMPMASDTYDFPVIVLGISGFALAMIIAIAGNFLFGWTFTSSGVWTMMLCLSASMGLICFIGKGWEIVPFGKDISPNLLAAAALMFLAVIIFCAVAIAVSTQAGQVMTLLVCFAFFLVGLAHPFIFAQFGSDQPGKLLSWIAPNLTYFLNAPALGKTIPADFIGSAAAYCACYSLAVLFIGTAMFQTRQLEAKSQSSAMPPLVSLLAWAGRIVCLAVVFFGVRHIAANYTTFGGISAGAIAIIVAALLWGLFGYFMRGSRWSWWVVMIISLLWLIANGVFFFGEFGIPVQMQPAQHLFAAAPAAIVVVILLLPGTRHHFQSAAIMRQPPRP